MGSGKGGKVTVGYKYYVGMHVALCHGPIDNIIRIDVDKRVAWEGASSGGAITIDAPDLFGGKGREGGVTGIVDIDMGGPSQGANTYLTSILGDDMPSFRGVVSAILNQVYMGNNPYLKPWSFRATRIFNSTDGATQWYEGKAGIARRDTGSNCFEIPCGGCDSLHESLMAHADYVWPLDDLTGATEARATKGTDLPVFGGPAQEQPAIFEGDCEGVTSSRFNGLNGWRDSTGPKVSVSLSGSCGGGIDAPSTGVRLVTIGFYNDTWCSLALTYSGSGDISVTLDGFGGSGSSDVTETWVNAFSNPAFIVLNYTLSSGGGGYSVELYADGESKGVRTGALPNGHTFDINSNTRYTVGLAGTGYAFGQEFFYSGTVLTELQIQNLSCTADECCQDMNPSHIIRECITDTVWGMGYTESDVDSDSFTDSADTLFDESMGISLLWSREMPIEDFMLEILRHIDGVLYVDRSTGKFVLKLIRDDVIESNMLTLDESSVGQVKNARRPTVGELTSSVTVNFWDAVTGETGSITEHNQPIIQIQGAITHTTIQYPGFTHYEIARRAALRDLTALSTSLLTCTITANRTADALNIGDAFILDWPDLNINTIVMRVQQMGLGDGASNQIQIDCIEDVFSLPGYVPTIGDGDPEDLWADPSDGIPLIALPRLVSEAPYYALVVDYGTTQINSILADDSDAGYLLAAGGRQGSELNARLHVDSGAGYADDAVLDFAPYAYITDSVGYIDTQINLRDGKDLDLVESGSIAQIGDELIRIDSITTDSNGQYITVGRGILDTVPAEHTFDSTTDSSAGDNISIIFWGTTNASDDVQYTASDSLNVKMQTVLGPNVLDIDGAPVNSVVLDSRAIRPYPPGLLTVDGEAYPETGTTSEIVYTGTHSLTWAHRDRLQQTDGNLYDYTEGDIGPEAGTTYLVEAYSTLGNGTTSGIWLTADVGSNNFFNQDSNTDTSTGEPPVDSRWVHFKVTARRDGYTSWQSPVATLTYEMDSVYS